MDTSNSLFAPDLSEAQCLFRVMLDAYNDALHAGCDSNGAYDVMRDTGAQFLKLPSREAALRNALERAIEWAAGYPLGGDADRHAANDVYEWARAALATESL